MSSLSSRHRVVIIGGGFAGVKCAKQLRRHLPPDQLEVIVFNRENHMVFHPLPAEVAGASINPDSVAAPLRQFLDRVDCRTEDVTAIDLDRQQVIYEHHDGRTEQLSYDHLVIACGRSVNLNAVPGMSDHALALKTVGDAVQIRARVIEQLEIADVSADEQATLEGDLGTSWWALGRQKFPDSRVGISLEIPIGHRAARGQLGAGTSGRLQAELALARLEEQIAVEVRNAATAIETAAGRVQAARAGSSLRKRGCAPSRTASASARPPTSSC